MDLTSINNRFNSIQSPLTNLFLELPLEVREDVLSALEDIEFVKRLTSKDRPTIDKVEKYDDGRIKVDITNPHILSDMDYFRQPGLYFKKHGRYIDALPSTFKNSIWGKYWKEEARKCLTYVVNPNTGEWIPGAYYFYLNYSPILRLILDNKGEIKDRILDLPDVYDGDYLYYHYLYQARHYKDDHISGAHASIIKARGKGYEQPNTELVCTPDGFKQVGDIKIGDYLVDHEGKPTKVLDIFPQGQKDVYEVTFSDGRKVKCGLNHLWEVYNIKGKSRVINTKYLLENTLKSNHNNPNKNYYKYRVVQNKEVIFNHTKTKLPIAPYTLGALIGDGSLSNKTFRISSNDLSIINRIKTENEDIIITKTKYDKYAYDITSKIKGNNRIIRSIKNLKLNVVSEFKFIPEKYKYASIEDRWALVQGLMDTDGTSSPNGTVRFTNTSERLIDDLAFVLRSLGVRVTKSKTNQGGNITTFNNGYKSIQKDCWVLNIITDNPSIFHLDRKKINIRKRKYNINRIAIVNVKKLDYKEESTCFLVDNNRNLYLTNNFIVTHNSFKAGSQLALGAVLGESLVATKRVKQMALASEKEYLVKDGVLNKFLDIIDHCAENTGWPRARNKSSWNNMEWVFGYIDKKTGILKGSGNEVLGVSMKDNPDKARGKRAAKIIYEEFGKFPNFLDTWRTNRPSTEAGKFAFGQQVAFGTGGTAGADFQGAEEMIYHPRGYRVYPLSNVFDKNASGDTESILLSPDYLNREGCYDVNGNSDVTKALIEIMYDRYQVKYNSSDPMAITGHIAEHAITIAEAIMRRDGTLFPVADLREYLEHISPSYDKLTSTHYIGDLIVNKIGDIEWRPNVDIAPIRNYPCKTNTKGAIEIFELPKKNGQNKIDEWRYIVGVDPVDDDMATQSSSLCSVFVFDMITDRIVAEYTGRPEFANDFYEIVRRLAVFYNAKVNYESNKKGLYSYFDNKNCIYLLTETLQILRDENMTKSVGYGNKRVGTNATQGINIWARRLIRDWLLSSAYTQDYDSDGNQIGNKLNMHTIRSKALLEELIKWNPDGNYDRVSALGMVMLFREDRRKYVEGRLSENTHSTKSQDDYFTRNFDERFGKTISYDSRFNF